MSKNQTNSTLINAVNEISTIARQRGIVHLFTQDEKFDGKTIQLKGKKHIHFGSCSYLGLELDPRLIEAGINALQRYGSQFSCSRTYVSFTLYEELEELLTKMFGKPVILSTCSTLGHQSVIPIIVEDTDAVILDQQAHVSMQEAVSKLQLRGITVSILRHNRLDDLQNKINELSQKHSKIWYFIDGVYSMYGDLAPATELLALLNTHKQLFIYSDDAHAMSWTGVHGTGYFKSQVQLHPQVVLATSLAKGFASAGGIFVLPNEEMYWKVKNWGGALTYSGPQQPAVIGASIASAKIHLSDEIYTLQKSLADKIEFCNDIFRHYELPLVSESDTPIFFVGLGLTKVGYNMVKKLSDEGYYTNLGIFPAVPETCTSIRFTLTNHHSLEDIEGLAERIAFHLPKALKEEGRTMKDIYRAFKSLSLKARTEERSFIQKEVLKENINNTNSQFTIYHYKTIKAIPEKLWNALFAGKGSFDWDFMALLEKSFTNNEKPEDNWQFHYYIVKGYNDIPVAATFFTCLLVKDDMLSSVDISEKIELARLGNPYYLTSKALMMGCPLTEGEHLFVNKGHSQWKDAISLLIDQIWVEQERQKCSMLLLRDFDTSDNEMKDLLQDMGFIKIELPDTHIIESRQANSIEEYTNQLPHRKKYHVRNDMQKFESCFTMNPAITATEEEIQHWYQLYLNVQNKNKEINTFKYPVKLFKQIAQSDKWDVLLLNIKPEYDSRISKLPVAVGFAYKGDNYYPSILGLDYNYLQDFKIYKQLLYQTLTRALDLNYKKIYFGLTASLEKRKLGAKASSKVGYVQLKDSYNMAVIEMMPKSGKVA